MVSCARAVRDSTARQNGDTSQRGRGRPKRTHREMLDVVGVDCERRYGFSNGLRLLAAKSAGRYGEVAQISVNSQVNIPGPVVLGPRLPI